MKFYVLEMDRFNDKEYCYGEQFDHNTGETLKCKYVEVHEEVRMAATTHCSTIKA